MLAAQVWGELPIVWMNFWMMNSIKSTQSSQIWRPWWNTCFPNCLWCSGHLFPDLGEGLEDGWQVQVLGRVEVASNVVHHLKCGLGEREEMADESFKDNQGKKELRWRCSHWGRACCSGSPPRVFRTVASAPGWQTVNIKGVTYYPGHNQQLYQISKLISNLFDGYVLNR